LSKASILVVDDDQMIRNSLARILSYEGYEVETAKNGEEGLLAHAKAKQDLVILDVSMPGLSGIDVCKRLKLRSPETPVLFLSAKDEVGDRVLGLESGGDDYLVKPFAFEELSARIVALLRRKIVKLPEILEFENLRLDDRTKRVSRGGVELNLSMTEYQILLYLMSCPNQVLSKEMILEHVWGPGFYADLNLVEVYIRYLRMKIEAGSQKRLIYTIRGAGYILRSEP